MIAASNLARAAAEAAEEGGGGDEAEELEEEEEVEEDWEEEGVSDSPAGVSLGGLVASEEEPGGVGGDPEVRNLACFFGHAARRHSIGCWCFGIIGLWLAASTVRRSGLIVVNLVDVAAVLNTGGGAEVRL